MVSAIREHSADKKQFSAEYQVTKQIDGGKGSIKVSVGKWPRGWNGVVFNERWTECVLKQQTKKADAAVIAANGVLRVAAVELKTNIENYDYVEQLEASLNAVHKFLKTLRDLGEPIPNPDIRVAVIYEGSVKLKTKQLQSHRDIKWKSKKVRIEFRKRKAGFTLARWMCE